MQLQNEVKSNLKQSSCKKSVWPKKATVKKDVKSKAAAKKWLWGRLMAKFDNSGEFDFYSWAV